MKTTTLTPAYRIRKLGNGDDENPWHYWGIANNDTLDYGSLPTFEACLTAVKADIAQRVNAGES